jgi:branched-chain amino acid transport system substrate-binding protein
VRAGAQCQRSVGGPAPAITTHHYSAAHDSAINRDYVKAYTEKFKMRPNFMSVGGYDGMAVVYEVVKELNGKMGPDKAMEIIKGMKIDSPRGPIQIAPTTRNVVQTVYVRKVEKKDGQLYNIEFDKFENVWCCSSSARHFGCPTNA